MVLTYNGIDSELFIENKFLLTDWLEVQYKMLMQKYMQNSQFDKPKDISNPFWHLQSDGFWHLILAERSQEGVTPSKRWLKENVKFAYFDESLWILLQNKFWRTKLREYIIEHKLTNSSWGNTIKASGLGIFAAFLLTA